jgi:hypothetical protein
MGNNSSNNTLKSSDDTLDIDESEDVPPLPETTNTISIERNNTDPSIVNYQIPRDPSIVNYQIPRDPSMTAADTPSYFSWQNSLIIAESIFYITRHLFRIYYVLSQTEDDNENTYDQTIIERELITSYNFHRHPTTTIEPPSFGIAGDAVLRAVENQKPFLVPEGPDSEAISEADECVVCRTNRKNTIFMPCGHSAMCITCSRDYHSREISKFDNNNAVIVCIICKEACTEIKRIYL